MPEKLTSIYTLPHLNSNTSPIIIQNGELLKNNENGKIFVRLKLENLSGKEIECIFVCIDSFDSDGKLLETINEYRYFGSKTHRYFGSKMQIFLNENSATSFQTVIRKVIFSDKSMLNLSDEDYESVCGQEPLSDSLQADEKTAGNEKKRIRILKKILLAELIAIAVLTLSAVIIFKQGYNIFKYAYEKGDYFLASKVYAWKTNSEDTMDAINDILQPEADRAYYDYNKSKIGYDDAKEIIDGLNEVSNNHFEDYNTKIDKLKSSKENFEKGKQLEQSNDYENALAAYQMVVADDTNYNEAQNGISRIKEKVHNDIIAQADKYVSNGNYKEGREYIAKNSGVLSVDEQSKYKEKFDAQEKAEKERKELFDKCYNVYKNVLLSLKKENSAYSAYKFTFAYINNDNIPDIFVTDGSYYAAGVRIYIYQNGMANKVTRTFDGEIYDKFGTNGQIAYAPKSNMIRSGSERAEFKGTSFIKITGSKAEEKMWFLIERAYDPLTEEFVDSKYSVSNKEVSKEEYVSQFNKTNNSYKWSNTPSYENLKNIDDNTIKNELKKYLK